MREQPNLGRWNIGVGLRVMAGVMLYGFYLICLRGFAPDAETRIAEYNLSPHFETRLADAHGNLFALSNIGLGLVLVRTAMRTVGPVGSQGWLSEGW